MDDGQDVGVGQDAGSGDSEPESKSATPIPIAELKRLVGSGEIHRATIHAQVDRATAKTTKAGKPFLDWLLRDADDSLSLKVWDNHPSFSRTSEVASGVFLEISGLWKVSGYGIEAPEWDWRFLTEIEVKELIESGGTYAEQQREDYQYIVEQVAGLEDPRLKAICSLFLERHGDRMRRTAAARDYHHARRGGLVEHVAQMMRTANALSDAYQHVNRGLIVAGVLFHDSGKLWENVLPERGFTMSYTEPGELLGHIPVGLELVNKLWRDAEETIGSEAWKQGEPSPGEVRLHLLHLIASHHGEYAFGSPTLPKTPEAQLLHYIDNIDAKMEMFRRGYSAAKMLAPSVFERVRPLPGNLVRPLQTFRVPEPVREEEVTKESLDTSIPTTLEHQSPSGLEEPSES